MRQREKDERRNRAFDRSEGSVSNSSHVSRRQIWHDRAYVSVFGARAEGRPLDVRMRRVTGLARKDTVPESLRKIFLSPCDSNHSAGRGPMSTLGFGRF